MSRKFILRGHDTIETDSLNEWARDFKDLAKRRVAYTEIAPDVHVSTVFLGLDHRFDDKGPPLLFETLVFGGALADAQERYSTWDEAAAGHEAMCKRAREAK